MKKILATILAAVLFISSVNMPEVHAEESSNVKNKSIFTTVDTTSTNGNVEKISGRIINSAYADFIPEEMPKASDGSVSIPYTYTANPSYSDVNSAGAYVCEQFVARQGNIQFSYWMPSYSSQIAQQILDDILDTAIAHTAASAPDEGDYLKFQLGGGWYNMSASYMGGSYCMQVTITMSYYTTAEQEQQVNSRVDSLLSSMGLAGKSDYQKIKIIYDYVTSHVTYDYATLYDDTTGKYTAYNALFSGTAVCQGYANLIYRLLREEGIDTRIVTSVDHAWNIVKLGEYYYNIDSTWDAGMGGAYNYFLKNMPDFEDDSSHIREAEYTTAEFNTAYPMAPLSCDPKNASITSGGIYILSHTNKEVFAGLVTTTDMPTDLEYRWLIYDINGGMWRVISDWTLNNEWISWKPDKSGAFLLQAEARVSENHSTHAEYCIGVNHHQQIKGKCQMPYEGAGGGYLIGVESYDNPNQSYQYELLILDCTLLAQNKPAWTYTTGRCGVSSGNAFWTVWQPQYGYYWTLFRVYDRTGNLLDEECFPFENVY